MKLADPQFEGQTKTKLGNTEVKGFVQKVSNEWLGDWFERNPGEAKTIITKAARRPEPAAAGKEARWPARGSRVGRAARQADGLLVKRPWESEFSSWRGTCRRLGQGRP